MKSELSEALSVNSIGYYRAQGKTLDERCEPLNNYGDLRTKYGVNSYGYAVMYSPIAPYVDAKLTYDPEQKVEKFLNFSSQDYMGMAQDERVNKAAAEVIGKLGIHTASSPAFTGRNYYIEELEEKLATSIGLEQVVLYTTGWMACFGAINSLAGEGDIIILDAFAHNSLQTAAKATTKRIYKFKHNDLENLEQILKAQREKEPETGILIVVETLYSMHADIIDIRAFYALAQKYEAILIVDIAHDLGVYGQKGLGVLEELTIEERNSIVVIGAFTKAFATNGGFVGGGNVIRGRTMLFSPPYTFSNAISPLQTAVALQSAKILFSPEGDQIRKKLHQNINMTRQAFEQAGFEVLGKPSPIVPVVVGDGKLARIVYRESLNQHLLANLAEFPAVPRKQSLFRFQLMATHEKEHIEEAVRRFSAAYKEAVEFINKNCEEKVV